MLMSRVLLEISDLNLRDCNGFKVKTDHEDRGKKIIYQFSISSSVAVEAIMKACNALCFQYDEGFIKRKCNPNKTKSSTGNKDSSYKLTPNLALT